MERVAYIPSSGSKPFQQQNGTGLRGCLAALSLLVLAALPASAGAAVYIGGTPKTSAVAHSFYSFQPWVSAPANSKLTFSILNRPNWASFSTSSGLLSGKVYAPNIGTYSNIRIKVTDGKTTASLPLFTIKVVASSTTGDPTTTAGTLQLSAPSYSVAQSAGSLTVQVNRTAGSTGAVSAAFGTISGSAVAGTDYTAVSGTLQWASGETATKSFSVPVKNSTPFTGTKSFTVALSKPSTGATIGTPASASAAITGTATTGSTAAPSAVTNLLLINQGGANNATAPLTNVQQISWSTAKAGVNPISYYRIYRNGAAYATTTALSYTDTNATGSNAPTWTKAAIVYEYDVTAVDTKGIEGPKASQMGVYAYRNGKSAWGNSDLSYGTLSENYSSTAGSPQGGTYDVAVNFINGGFQPSVAPPQAPEWDLEIGAFNYAVIDINPGSVVNTHYIGFGTVSRLPPGDVYGWHPVVNVYDYGPAPVANKWATYKVPLTTLGMGTCEFTGSISGSTLTVTGIVSGEPLVDAGGFISGPGVPAGTYIKAYGQHSATGTFTLAGPGISSGTRVSSTRMTFQRTSLYKFGLQPDVQNMTMYFNNMGFTAK